MLSKNNEVVVYEKHEVVGEPLQCAEGWWAHTLKPPEDFVVREIERALIRYIDGEFRLKDKAVIDVRNLIFTIDRRSFERDLAKQAEENGAIVFTGKKVKISDLDSDIIIDASGYPPQYDKEFGTKKKGAIAIEAICKCDIEDMIIDLQPGFDGYYWIFPKEEGIANIGVGYFKRKLPNMKEMLNKYINTVGAEPIKWTGGIIGCTLNIPLVRGNVVLVGDAAGLCDRLFAEGMSKAMISSRVLAKNILSLQNYEHDLMKVLGRHLWITGVLSKIRDSTPYYMFVKLIKIVSFMHKFIKIKGLNSTTELFPPVNLLHDS